MQDDSSVSSYTWNWTLTFSYKRSANKTRFYYDEKKKLLNSQGGDVELAHL